MRFWAAWAIGIISLIYLPWQWPWRQDRPAEINASTYILQGQIVGLPEWRRDHWQFLLQAEQLDVVDTQRISVTTSASDEHRYLPKLLLMKWYQRAHQHPQNLLQPGQRWRFHVQLKPPRGLVNPQGFDYERWLFASGIDAIATIKDQSLNAAQLLGQNWTIDAWRAQISEQLQQAAPGRVAKALLPALLIGDRRGLTDADWQLMQQTGISHLMAISGMHITLLAVLAYALANGLYRVLPSVLMFVSRQAFASSVAVLMALIYALLAGLQVSTQRAVLMIFCVLLARLAHWRFTAWQILLIAWVMITTFNPRSVLDAGLWLSFAAVAVIFWVLAPKPTPRGWRLFLQIQWQISLGLLPLSLFLFGSSSWISPLVNVLMIPLIEWLVVPLLFLWSALPSNFPGVDLLLVGLAWLLEQAWQLLTQLTQSSWLKAHLQIQLPPLGLGALGVIYLLWLLTRLPAPWPGRYCLCLLMLPVLLPKSAAILQPGEFKLAVLDVGQGLATVIQTQQHLLVYDTGNAKARFDAGRDIVVPYLKAASWSQWRTLSAHPVDRLLLSHQDRDHAGGVQGVVDHYPVQWLMSLVPAQQQHDRSVLCQAGASWLWDGVQFDVLFPLSNTLLSNTPLTNTKPQRNLSCVLRVRGRHHSVLLSGDIERNMEQMLIHHYASNELQADVLVVPHHGSKTSSGSGFLHAVSPQYALISAGWRNRFGHPHPTVVQRYLQRDIQLWNTADCGAIELTSTQFNLSIQAAREGWQPVWRYPSQLRSPDDDESRKMCAHEKIIR
jgi:competence protein ComEC